MECEKLRVEVADRRLAAEKLHAELTDTDAAHQRALLELDEARAEIERLREALSTAQHADGDELVAAEAAKAAAEATSSEGLVSWLLTKMRAASAKREQEEP